MFTLLLLISQCLLAHALRFQLKQNAREQLHDLSVPVEEIKRQALPVANGPAFGIGSIASLPDAAVIPTTAITLATPSTPLPSTLSLSTASLSTLSISTLLPSATSISNPPVTSVPAVLPTATISDIGIPTYVFPSSIVQVPVATLCPNNVTSNNISSLSSSTVTIPPAATGLLNTTSAKLTVGSGHDAQLRVAEHGDADIARVVLGNDSCQTVYTPKTTAICSTEIRMPGALPVRVTRCDQWVTFSTALPGSSCQLSTGVPVRSSSVSGGVSSVPSIVPRAGVDRDAAVVNVTSVATAITTPAVPSISSSSVLPTIPISTSISTTSSVGLTSVQDILYYVAHWWDLATNTVPSIVRVEDCAAPSNTGDACAVHTESWSVSTSTSTRTGTTVITYTGPVVFSSATYTLTTTISISSIITTTQTVTMPTIIRSVLGGNGPTVTVSVTLPTATRTYSLESVDISAATATATVTRRVTVTRTVAETLTGGSV